MSETVLTILLAELTTVQIVCHLKECGTVVELSVERLAKVEADGGEIRCPVCQAVLQSPHYSAVGKLADAVTKIVQRRKDVEVRFVIPTPPEAAK